MRVLMLVATSVDTDTRVLREAATLVGAGHRVHVVGKDVPPGFVPPAGITVSSAGATSSFRPAGSPSLTGRRLPPHVRLARWALLPSHRNQAFGSWARGAVVDARERAFDVVHAHDFTALAAAAELAAERDVPYVYDTHEYWLGRQRQYRPTPLQDRRERDLERRLGAAAAAVITVGEGVATALRRDYDWPHVVVVRNSFPAPEHLARSSGDAGPAGLVYAGRIDADRELETVERAAPDLDGISVTLVGPVDDVWLGRHARALDAAGVALRPALPVDEVTELLAAEGLALVTHSDRFESHRLALPNKLFHAVHAGVPVVATDVPELARVVRQYDIGELYRPGDATGLAAAVGRAVDRYADLRAHVLSATAELSWDADARVLVGLYARLSAYRTHPPR